MTRLRFFVTTKRPIMSKHTHDGSTRTNIAVARPVLEIYRSVLYRRRIPKQSYFVGRLKNGLWETPVGVARWRWNLVKFTQLLCRRERSRQIVKSSRSCARVIAWNFTNILCYFSLMAKRAQRKSKKQGERGSRREENFHALGFHERLP